MRLIDKKGTLLCLSHCEGAVVGGGDTDTADGRDSEVMYKSNV